MTNERDITVIPATRPRFSTKHQTAVAKRHVAAYARVSTDHVEQLTSYEAQVDYYTRHMHITTVDTPKGPAESICGFYI